MVPQNAGQGNLIATEERDAGSVFPTVVAGPPPFGPPVGAVVLKGNWFSSATSVFEKMSSLSFSE